jgi:hypothetical protein
MQSVADLVEENMVRSLTTPALFDQGQQIADNDGVSFNEFTPLKVSAFVTSPADPITCNTVLEAAPAGLKWNCSCLSNKAQFCQHLVATALETWRKARASHTTAT